MRTHYLERKQANYLLINPFDNGQHPGSIKLVHLKGYGASQGEKENILVKFEPIGSVDTEKAIDYAIAISQAALWAALINGGRLTMKEVHENQELLHGTATQH